MKFKGKVFLIMTKGKVFLIMTTVTMMSLCRSDQEVTNTPEISWKTQVDPSGVWSYRIILGGQSNCTTPQIWDSGNVWQENEPFSGSCRYTGPSLEPNKTYFWCCWENQLRSASGNMSPRHAHSLRRNCQQILVCWERKFLNITAPALGGY